MVCVQCGSDTKVTNSRPQKRLNQVWRRRECLNCGTIFTTEEAIDYHATWRVRSKASQLQPFLPIKLTISLYASLEHRPNGLQDASDLTQTIIGRLQPQFVDGIIDHQHIIQTVQVALNRFDHAASTHYAAHHH